jgi:two-component system sensor kinase
VEALQVELRRTRDDAQATAQVRVADGVRWLGAGQPEKAVRALKAAWRAIRAKGINNAWVSPVLPWLATAIRQQAEGLPPYARHRRDRLLRLAGRVVRAALCITRRFRNDLPHALREKGLLSALQADGRAARRYLEQSLQEARRQGARYEYAQSLSARGRVGRGLGWSGAARDLAEGQRLIGELERGILKPEEDSSDTRKSLPTLSLVDRFDTLLDAGRKIASALDREAVFGAVQEGALRLLRGEQCQIIPAPGAGWPLAEQVFRAKQTVVHSESSANVRLEELGLPGVRSVLCTPVFVRGQAAACFCVTHRHVLDLFRDDEVRLAEFIAAIAGAALENAAGYAELQRLNVTLEQRVAERTADLEASTKELANSNAELEQFAYVASHDLQEPLRTVTSYCRLLEENCQGHLDAKTREYMDQVLDGAQRMRTLISDLLTYSRVGRRGRPFQPTDCNAVLDLALSNLKLTIEETGAVVTRTPLPEVLGDPTQLLQLFQNLLGNAIKFRKAQPPHVDIQAERSGAEWVFSVRDDGIGIEPEHLERIFLIFHRLHTREEYPGTGIGLAVCKKTVERHGGRIWVESRPGEGSTFRFALAAMPKSRETSA